MKVSDLPGYQGLGGRHDDDLDELPADAEVTLGTFPVIDGPSEWLRDPAWVNALVERLAAGTESMEPIIVLAPDPVLPASVDDVFTGWHRLATAKRLGWTEVPAYHVHLDDEW